MVEPSVDYTLHGKKGFCRRVAANQTVNTGRGRKCSDEKHGGEDRGGGWRWWWWSESDAESARARGQSRRPQRSSPPAPFSRCGNLSEAPG